MQKHLKKHAFTLWLLFVVVLAVLFPAYGSKGGLLYPEISTNIGVWLIFFLQGIALPTSELTSGYSPKRLHAFVLSWNYIIFPIVVGLLLLPLSLVLPNELRLGFWLLAILPTTVSSAVVFSTVSKGNTSNAIFSTVFSNLLSVLLVPAVAVAYLSLESGVSLSLSPLFSKLFLLIIAPLILGQLVRKWLPKTSALLANRTKGFGNWIIVFIVHCAFAQSVSSGFLIQLGLFSIFKVISITILILLVVSQFVWWSSNLLNLSKEQRISAFFCSSQKSLATGLPLTTSILALAPGIVDAASVLIPLMCYHPAQLILAGILS
ncbi:MAG: bile acid:sodium symporter, partial [Puniceicoccaceae bacterium]|nr:bile acid:sodium symporter [Puniceicoccaceae bacterium]